MPLVLGSENEHAPHPLATLNHLATAILRVSSLRHEADRRRARDRSLPEPGWGLGEGREGVLVGLGRQPRKSGVGGGEEEDGLVVEMELRRRSGRAVTETFVLVPSPRLAATATTTTTQSASALTSPARISLLSDHPLFRKGGEEEGGGEGGAVNGGGGGGGGADDENGMETTFSLGLTEKQRRDREGVVLPYFDAQMDIGGGEGGRILYEMGREDDFDDEEDEI